MPGEPRRQEKSKDRTTGCGKILATSRSVILSPKNDRHVALRGALLLADVVWFTQGF